MSEVLHQGNKKAEKKLSADRKEYEKVPEQMVLHNQEKNIEELLHSYVAAFFIAMQMEH